MTDRNARRPGSADKTVRDIRRATRRKRSCRQHPRRSTLRSGQPKCWLMAAGFQLRNWYCDRGRPSLDNRPMRCCSKCDGGMIETRFLLFKNAIQHATIRARIFFLI